MDQVKCLVGTDAYSSALIIILIIIIITFISIIIISTKVKQVECLQLCPPKRFTGSMVPQPTCWWKSDGHPVYSQATSPGVKSWGSAEIVQTDRFSMTRCSFKICNEILKYEIQNNQNIKMCNEILKGALFLRCPCWSLCQVFSGKHPHCLMWTFILLPLCLWFSLSFWLL